MTCGPKPTKSMKTKKSLQTLLTATDYRPPEGFAAFPAAIHHASTVLFKDVAALRARIDGAPGTSAIRTTIFLNTAGSVCAGVAVVPVQELDDTVSVEHPTGEFSVALDPATPHNVTRADLLRTARMLLRGEVLVPASVLDGVRK